MNERMNEKTRIYDFFDLPTLPPSFSFAGRKRERKREREREKERKREGKILMMQLSTSIFVARRLKCDFIT